MVPPHLHVKEEKHFGAKEALEYVSWLVNPNKLFDEALKTYDLELVTLVATQT